MFERKLELIELLSKLHLVNLTKAIAISRLVYAIIETMQTEGLRL